MNHKFLPHILLSALMATAAMPAGATDSAEVLAMSRADRAALTTLVLTGNVTPEVLTIIRDEMVVLRKLDLSGATMTEIPDFAFAGKSKLKYLTLPDGLTRIGDGAFMTCPNLMTVTLPEGLTTIGRLAFSGGGLKTLTMGAAVTSIGHDAFTDCHNFRTINLAEGNTNYCLIDGALYSADKTRLIKRPAKAAGTLTFPEELKIIEPYACENCTTLEMPQFNEGLTTIGDYAFQDCKAMTGVLEIPASVTTIGKGAFFGCTGVKETLTIAAPAHLTGDYTYAYMSGIKAISLAETISGIPASAFELCTGVKTISPKATVPPTVGTMAFRGIDRASTYVDVPEASVDAYKNAPVWEDFDNYDTPAITYNIFSTNGNYRIKYVGEGDAKGKYLTFVESDGARAALSEDAEEATVWELSFFNVTHTALPYVNEMGSDIRFTDGTRCKHVNNRGTCWNDPLEGYTNNANRTFAFYISPNETAGTPNPLVAIRGNATLWNADESAENLLAGDFSGSVPPLSAFVWQLENIDYDSISELPANADSRIERFYDLRGNLIDVPRAAGIYIGVTADGKAIKIKE